jgi:hypothetical protein
VTKGIPQAKQTAFFSFHAADRNGASRSDEMRRSKVIAFDGLLE